MKPLQVTVGMLREALNREGLPDDWVLVVELGGATLAERRTIPIFGLGTNRPNEHGPQEFAFIAHAD